MSRKSLLLDTNVWLDIEMPGDNHDRAWELLLASQNVDARLGIAAHSLKDVFYLIQRRLKLENREDGAIPAKRVGTASRVVAWAVVDHIMEIAEIVGSDYSDAYIATKQRPLHDDYEDDLVIAAAMRMNADFLVTSDEALLKHAPVATLTPADAAAWLAENDDGR